MDDTKIIIASILTERLGDYSVRVCGYEQSAKKGSTKYFANIQAMVGLKSRCIRIAIAALLPVAFSNAFATGRNVGVRRSEQLSSRVLFMAKDKYSKGGATNGFNGKVISRSADLEGFSTYQTLFTCHDPRNRRTSEEVSGSSASSLRRGELLRFIYDFDELVVGNGTSSEPTNAVMLIHPIGVGIGRWYYDRLMESLHDQYGDMERRVVFLSPDLLGSGTACAPITESGDDLMKLPLLNISDWSEQVEALMADYETKSEAKGYSIDSWSIVANGGCSPIALKVAKDGVQGDALFKGKVTNVIISAPPRLQFFLRGNDPEKVKKSYRTLSGILGNMFWWYSLRRNGKFVQKFSEKNLVGMPENLGDDWTPNCVATARICGGRSRYSTFAFLAGTLQDGCSDSLEGLKGSGVKIDFIRGTDKRRNSARSWFWQRQRKKGRRDAESRGGNDNVSTDIKEKRDTSLNEQEAETDTIQKYVQMNGNRGETAYVGGRISLAHEDANGYAHALMKFIK
eukprot:CAMPEP_0178696052 /NCGR_PEP_ID=MMETSP0699-20121125/9200_1 /TAXON_ID=265572 /ORGANISM="Extubocellulus spinifer, Strain CCMP396" /LENGTH=511 /DNA_ID=CAMNT_0020341825 /DNA_START=29 /DNA_END=1564 /DNA_ORIENTATION=-